MTKGIIVLNDIPVICAECNFASLKCSGKYLWCNIKKEFCNSSKPDWCPIRPVDYWEQPEDVVEREYNNLPWIRAIVVNIDLPEV